MAEAKKVCCWVQPDAMDGCERPAAFKVWTRNDAGQAVLESDLHCCDAHLPWASVMCSGDGGAIVYALEQEVRQ